VGRKLRLVLALKMEVTCSSETSADFQQTTWCYIPDNRTIHNTAVRTSNCMLQAGLLGFCVLYTIVRTVQNLLVCYKFELVIFKSICKTHNCKAFFSPMTEHFLFIKARVLAGKHFQ
jgi:hypothetical protein